VSPTHLFFAGCLIALSGAAAQARGASPYLPLNQSPEIERQIERLMILADKPILSRPLAAATVLDALPAACRIDEVLCRSVRRYLERYTKKFGVGHATTEFAAVDVAAVSLPDRHGRSSESTWEVNAQGYWQPSDYLIVSVGAIAHDDDVVPTGSMVSFGNEYAQLDVGYRDHWLSPFTHSAMLMSTQAPTLPSITVSNYRPFGRLGFQYELFLAEMGHSDRIAFGDGFTAGRPRLAGMRLSIQPVPGWALGANRLMQFGGGARGGTSFGDLLDAFFKPRSNDNRSSELSQDQEFGNQLVSLTSRFIFPGAVPFTAYLEYAGEDTSYEGDHRLGNAALSIGLTFPRLWRRFDLTYEASEWQNGWYVHGIYTDGLTTDGHVLGHWGADQRVFGDGVGAQTHMLRLGWDPDFGGYAQLRLRTVDNENYTAHDYQRGYDLTVSYARSFSGMTVGSEIMAGRDVFGDTFSRVAGFVRFGDEWAEGIGGTWAEEAGRPRGADLFVDAGVNVSRVTIRLGDDSPKQITSAEVAPHVGIGARRAVSERSDLGVRLEIDRINDELLLAVRALDYRYRFRNPIALTAFLGAARYDLATPAYGYYLGAGAQWRDLFPRLDLSLDLRYADKVARDKLLPSDPAPRPRDDSFYDIDGATLSFSYRF
jgi:Capsule assembly protein Wzi